MPDTDGEPEAVVRICPQKFCLEKGIEKRDFRGNVGVSLAGRKTWKFFVFISYIYSFSKLKLMDATVLGWGFVPQECARGLFRTMNEFSHCLCCLFHLLARTVELFLLSLQFVGHGSCSLGQFQWTVRSLSEVAFT